MHTLLPQYMQTRNGVWHFSDSVPRWWETAVRTAHGDSLPDNYVFYVAAMFAQYVAECDSIAQAQECLDDWHSDHLLDRNISTLVEWLESADAIGYVDEVIASGIPCGSFRILLTEAQRIQNDVILNILMDAVVEEFASEDEE